MSKPRIGIVLTTTRETRFGIRPAQWLLEIAKARGDAEYELIDLRDFPLPLFDLAMSPGRAPVQGEVQQRWAAKMAELDGYVFVTAEYNHSVSGAVKNALDYLYFETRRKPAAFLGYGAVGGARAVEQLRLILAELGAATTASAVYIGMEPMLGMMREGKDFADYPYLAESAVVMLDELVWWAQVLRTGRQEHAAKAA